MNFDTQVNLTLIKNCVFHYKTYGVANFCCTRADHFLKTMYENLHSNSAILLSDMTIHVSRDLKCGQLKISGTDILTCYFLPGTAAEAYVLKNAVLESKEEPLRRLDAIDIYNGGEGFCKEVSKLVLNELEVEYKFDPHASYNQMLTAITSLCSLNKNIVKSVKDISGI